MASDEITLRRMNHSRNLIQFFEGLMESSSLVDCTIAAEGQYVKAHRVILSACSPYFELLFSQNENNPVVILKDTKFEILKAVIDFIYRGQINLPQDRLMYFVAAIESLQIIGMENGSENIEETGIQVQPFPTRLENEWPECNSVSCFRTEIKTEHESFAEMFPLENKFLVMAEEGIVKAAQVYEGSDENAGESTAACCSVTDAYHYETAEVNMESVRFDEPPNESENAVPAVFPSEGAYGPCSAFQHAAFPSLEQNPAHAGCSSSCTKGKILVGPKGEVVEVIPILENHEDETDHQLQPPLSSQETECNSVSSFCPNIDTEQENSTEMSPMETTFLVETEGAVDATELCESNEGNVEESIAASSCQTDSYHFEKSANSDGPPNASMNSAQAEFCLGENGESSVETNGVIVQEIPILEKTQENGADHSNIEVNNSERADESAEKAQRKRTRTRKRPYCCDECGLSFCQARSLKTHKLFHTAEKPYRCDECGVSFSVSQRLKVHKQTHTGEKPYRCDVCGVSCSQLYGLKVHKRTHTGEKPYRCDVCGVSCSQLSGLKVHKRTHTGEKPYRCDVCGVSFSQLSGLKGHTLIHTGKKPYRCGECGVSFMRSQHLKDHTRIHTGEKPYRCDECGVSFTHSTSLRVHKRTHTGEKPYRCGVCGVSYRHLGGLKNHKLSHAREKSHRCGECGVSFNRVGNLKKHKLTHAGKKP